MSQEEENQTERGRQTEEDETYTTNKSERRVMVSYFFGNEFKFGIV